MHVAVPRSRVIRMVLGLSLAFCTFSQLGCGPEDYQKPIQQFEDASNVVINATQESLKNANTVEQDIAIDNTAFKGKPLNLPAIGKNEIISPQEIKIRMDALKALSQYTSNLAELAGGKAGSTVGANTQKLSDSLKTLANDAKSLPASKANFIHNPKFSGLAGAAASAIGSVAQLVVEHKARRAIENSVVANDAAVTNLIQQIGIDAHQSYVRQSDAVGNYGDQLSKDYQKVLARGPDPILLLYFAKTVKSYRTEEAQLALADPQPAINKMEKAHEALVAYVKSDRDPQTLAQLTTAVQNFVAAATPLGQAVENLVSTSQNL
ncbi:MAG TPA: hypothetical protein VMW54_15600 [Terriglobia bacterium]|nr:hypothetical protein [Terriglobia bacterium]